MNKNNSITKLSTITPTPGYNVSFHKDVDSFVPSVELSTIGDLQDAINFGMGKTDYDCFLIYNLDTDDLLAVYNLGKRIDPKDWYLRMVEIMNVEKGSKK